MPGIFSRTGAVYRRIVSKLRKARAEDVPSPARGAVDLLVDVPYGPSLFINIHYGPSTIIMVKEI